MFNVLRWLGVFLGGYFVGDTGLVDQKGGGNTGGWTSQPPTGNFFSNLPKWFILASIFVGYLIYKELNK